MWRRSRELLDNRWLVWNICDSWTPLKWEMPVCSRVASLRVKFRDKLRSQIRSSLSSSEPGNEGSTNSPGFMTRTRRETRGLRMLTNRQTESLDHRIPRQSGSVDASSSVWNSEDLLAKKSITLAAVVDGPFTGLFLCKKTIHIHASPALRAGRTNRALRRWDPGWLRGGIAAVREPAGARRRETSPKASTSTSTTSATSAVERSPAYLTYHDLKTWYGLPVHAIVFTGVSDQDLVGIKDRLALQPGKRLSEQNVKEKAWGARYLRNRSLSQHSC